MTCELAEGVRVHFLTSGIVLQVYDLSTRNNTNRYSHASVEVSAEAGHLLDDNGEHQEPVEVTIGGRLQDRYIYSADSLEVMDDEAHFKLYDQLKVLDSGVVSEHFDEIRVDDFMDWLVDNIDDPHGVITGWKAVSEDLLEQEEQSRMESLVERIHGGQANAARDGWKGAINKAIETAGNAASNAPIGPKFNVVPAMANAVEFDDASPGDALAEIQRIFDFSSWVDKSGVLWIGHRESVSTDYHAVSGLPDDDGYAIKEYNIVSGAANVTHVHLTGMSLMNPPEGQAQYYEGVYLYPIARAWVEDPETGDVAHGQSLAPDEPVEILELESLESAARNRLIQATMEYKNGNVVFNGTASAKKEELVNMEVGDVLVVADYVKQYCRPEADTGAFTVTEVQHKISPRNGWKVTVEVGLLPENIQSEGIYYDPAYGTTYDDMESYNNDFGE